MNLLVTFVTVLAVFALLVDAFFIWCCMQPPVDNVGVLLLGIIGLVPLAWVISAFLTWGP